MSRSWTLGPIAAVAALIVNAACSSSKPGASTGGGPGTSSDAGPGSGGSLPSDGGPPPDGAASCVPAIPSVAWTSPYAGWSKGVPTDPTFFPIAVWLQQSFHAAELAQLGVNVYVGNNA